MNDLVKKTLVVCATISGFAGSAYIGDSVLGSYIKAKTTSAQILDASESEAQTSQPAPAADTAKPKAAFSFQFGR